jgi:hypothetical protein
MEILMRGLLVTFALLRVGRSEFPETLSRGRKHSNGRQSALVSVATGKRGEA